MARKKHEDEEAGETRVSDATAHGREADDDPRSRDVAPRDDPWRRRWDGSRALGNRSDRTVGQPVGDLFDGGRKPQGRRIRELGISISGPEGRPPVVEIPAFQGGEGVRFV